MGQATGAHVRLARMEEIAFRARPYMQGKDSPYFFFSNVRRKTEGHDDLAGLYHTLSVRLIASAVLFPVEPARGALALGLLGGHVEDEFQGGWAGMPLLEDGVALAIRFPEEGLPRGLLRQQERDEDLTARQLP